ncbi:MAG: hypothetical protein WD073_07615 [Xanthobacteraceae bacterium]
MQRIISTIVRTKAGGIKTSNRETIADDDDHTGLNKAIEALKKDGATMVLILGADDSVLRHWTRPDAAWGG